MGPCKERTVRVGADSNLTLNLAQQAVTQCGWKITKVDASTIKAQSGITFNSWGETIVIQVRTMNGQTFLKVSSEFVWGLFDLAGTNKKNVEKYLLTLSKLVQIQ